MLPPCAVLSPSRAAGMPPISHRAASGGDGVRRSRAREHVSHAQRRHAADQDRRRARRQCRSADVRHDARHHRTHMHVAGSRCWRHVIGPRQLIMTIEPFTVRLPLLEISAVAAALDRRAAGRLDFRVRRFGLEIRLAP